VVVVVVVVTSMQGDAMVQYLSERLLPALHWDPQLIASATEVLVAQRKDVVKELAEVLRRSSGKDAAR
jgi:hypothetical protein